MSDVGVHRQHEVIDFLAGEVVGGEQRVGNQQGRVQGRPVPRPGRLPIGLEEVGDEPVLGGRATERLRAEPLDGLERLLAPWILERGEVAHEHCDLDHPFRIGIPHPLGRTVGIEADARLLAGVVEGLLVGVGLEAVLGAQLVDQPAGVVAGGLTAEGRGQDQPGAVLLGQRVHGLGICIGRREPGRGQPALAARGGCGDRGDQRHDERQGQTTDGREVHLAGSGRVANEGGR